MAKYRQPRRLLAFASRGGTWRQLQLISPAFDGFECIYATTLSDSVLTASQDVEFVIDFNRATLYRAVLCAWQVFRILRRVKPHVIVTTGCAPAVLFVVFGRWMGCKTVWVDSLANAFKLSGSARAVIGICHVVLTQWEQLESDGECVFWGRIF